MGQDYRDGVLVVTPIDRNVLYWGQELPSFPAFSPTLVLTLIIFCVLSTIYNMPDTTAESAFIPTKMIIFSFLAFLSTQVFIPDVNQKLLSLPSPICDFSLASTLFN
jgi:hypothetical protein